MSATMGMWECRHGVDGRDTCNWCTGPYDEWKQRPPGDLRTAVNQVRAWIEQEHADRTLPPQAPVKVRR